MNEQPPPVAPQPLGYHTPTTKPPIAGIAVAALIVGLLGFVPLACFGAIGLGWMALKRTKDPNVRGRGLAIAGLVLGILWLGLSIAAIPATIMARRQAMRVQCMSNMRQIGQTLMIYASTNRGFLPPDLATAGAAVSGMRPAVYVCPTSTDTPAPNMTTLNAGKHLSYVYLGAGLQLMKVRPASQTVLVYEASPFHGGGTNALFADGHVEVITPAQLAQLKADLAAGKTPVLSPRLSDPTGE